MRKRLEIGFDVLYLALILANGVFLLWLGSGRLCVLFGAMALVLGCGDLFHLVPRMSMLVTGRPNHRSLGRGKWVTSLTSTAYYVLLYQTLALLRTPPPGWTTAIYGLAVLRLVLCCLPQNRWYAPDPPLSWGIGRNLPFVAMGAMVVAMGCLVEVPALGWLPVAVTLSFLFYLPVVLFGTRRPVVGMLMMPKTLTYLWIQAMGTGAILAALHP